MDTRSKMILFTSIILLAYFFYYNVEINWKDDSHAIGESIHNDEGIGAPWGLGWWYKGTNLVDPVLELKEDRSVTKVKKKKDTNEFGEYDPEIVTLDKNESFKDYKQNNLKENGIENFSINPEYFNNKLGQYSNIYINGKNDSHDLKKIIYTSFGTPNPLNDIVPVENDYSNATYVDGTPDSPKSMAMFKYNKCKSECCPATYSCSNGCICQTDNQKNFINNRGNNRTAPSEY